MSVRIKVKQTLAAVELLVRDNVPQTVISNIIGQTFDVEQNGSDFLIPCFDGKWNVAAECVEILPK